LSSIAVPPPQWKSSRWLSAPTFCIYRDGRYLIAELFDLHQVVTTSACLGGLSREVRHLVNHQSCEASEHLERYAQISRLGAEGYHRAICNQLLLCPETTATMGTAANMIYASHESLSFGDVRVDAVITAGVEGNATCAGDPARWVESPEGWNKLPLVAGTINTIVIVNQPLKPEAAVRALMTITEAKTAALMELGVSSRYSPDLATGTGTDQVCIATPMAADRYAYTSTSPHTKLGELLGRAVRVGTRRALQWQNGLEPSLTRSLVHALRRFGFSEAAFIEEMQRRLPETLLCLLEKNRNAILYEPQVSAAAYAFACIWDRMRFGVLPASSGGDVLRQQAATLATALAARSECWHDFWTRLEVDLCRPLQVVYDAVALGWTAKWE
jgi:adenosylcobinamide amidohydrolase